MRYNVAFDPEAIEDLQRIRAFDRRAILDTIERVLTTVPTQLSRSRIKRLRGTESPEYRLRIGEYRAFYDVDEPAGGVYVLRVLSKADVADYLKDVQDASENGEH